MKILVTGDSGFIGTNLINQLKPEFTFITSNKNKEKRVDILDRDRLTSVETTDAIIHLASKTSITNSVTDPYDTYNTNIVGTLNILEFAKERKIDRIINISTYVYGNPVYLPIDENHPIAPHTPYNKSKLIAENLCKYYSEDYGISIVTLRPFYIYGPSSKDHSFVPSIIRQINKSGKVILSQENTKRDFLYVSDFINLISSILHNFPKGYTMYNVGFGKSYSLENIVKIIGKILEKEISIEYNNSLRPYDITEMYADIKRLKKLYGWSPHVNIEEGLRTVLNIHRSHN
jgi:UDP-glucose 4-epimerase